MVYIYKCVFLIVMDLVGIGELLDVEKYNDKGVDMFGYIVEYCNGFCMFNMVKFGLSNICEIKGIDKVEKLLVYYIKMQEVFVGKDIMIGYWEIMGFNIDMFFNVFSDGFSEELIL